ncbi:polysaccharide biosynthesis tyrosine autokinase [Bacteroides caecigallinarum]|uniref:GumC family protein n=1 Tax=Bacteroides caecigallinarum TaxID=1411144 RepID=UPI00195983B5|nr:tyrosine-protein kinase family protein [Bacteroides caecigallinarum]MBM6960805.1 polysaccharide biosynthesis tyrosine autokinase [Bacteroides caecigallinarum]
MQNNNQSRSEQNINLLDLLIYLASKWKWYLLSVLIFGGMAWYKYATTPYVYFGSATVIIKDPSNKTSTTGLDRFDNFINKVNVANEMLQFNSKRLIREVVSRTHADVSYKMKDGLRNVELYTKSPVAVSFADMLPEQYVAFTVTLLNKDSVEITDFSMAENGERQVVELNDTISLNEGKVVVVPTNYMTESWIGVPVKVSKMPLDAVVSVYRNSIAVKQEEEESSILTLALKDNSSERAEDILNMLVNVYNEETIRDKNQVAVNTANFINERLIIIGQELGDVESDLESFKRENQTLDISSSASMYLGESQKYNSSALELETQLRLAQYIKEYLTDPKKEADLIPSNTGISDMNIENQIGMYNAAKLKRDRLISDSSDKNPVVEELNSSLRAMKQSIIRAVDNMIVSINVKRNDAQNREMRVQERLSAMPTKERQMLSIERQQKIKESLYLFLLNKREENALSQAMADNNARVIDSAEATKYPISPNRNKILALGILLGLALPTVAFLVIMFMDTRIHSRKDILGAVSVPFLGEIPLDKNYKSSRKGVANAYGYGDNVVTEAFRILRTNMSFMAKKDKPLQVITFTSFNSGAGKSFVAKNLADSLAYTKKKVILIDLDIRKGSLSHRMHKHGVGMTNYLADETIALDDIIHDCGKDYDFINAGTSAPNPAELLMDSRLDSMMEELRKRYDYIVVDNVPLGLVADATIANRIADITIFVVRAGRLDKRQLPDIEKLYQEKVLNNMALILNGADLEHRGYGYGSYGYGYGYGYGSNNK